MFLTYVALFVAACSAAPANVARDTCTAAQRIAGAEIVPYAYNLVDPGASARAFETLPVALDCKTYVIADGAPPAQVAIDGPTTIDFVIATRQIFSRVTSTYTDYADTGDTVMHANITLGALHVLAIPVTFHAEVTLAYNLATCLIESITAVAIIPTEVGGIPIEPPILPQILTLAVLSDPSV